MGAITICSDFWTQENKVSHCFYCFSIYLPWSDGTRCHDFVFWILSFKPTFSLSSFIFIKRLFSSSSLSAIRVVSSAYRGYWYFSQQSWFQLVLHPAWHFAWCLLHISYISRVKIYSLDVLFSRFATSPLFHVQFSLLLLDLHTDFSGGRSGGLVFPSLWIFNSLLWSTLSKALA